MALVSDSAAYAVAAGLPPNRFITVHWGQLGISDASAAEATGKLLKFATDWARAGGGVLAAVWTRENGDRKGSHSHILLHVPPHLDGRFPPMTRRWVKVLRGERRQVRGTVKTERIGRSVRAFYTSPKAYLEDLGAVVAYILKGAVPAAAEALALDRLEPGGTIIGKRAGTTQNIGRAAQRRAGWRAE